MGRFVHVKDRRELSHFLQRVFDLVNEEIDKNHGKFGNACAL